jgi:hypothetical protein
LDNIEEHLDKYGFQLSDAERKQFNDAAEDVWETRVKYGCPA